MYPLAGDTGPGGKAVGQGLFTARGQVANNRRINRLQMDDEYWGGLWNISGRPLVLCDSYCFGDNSNFDI